MNTIRLTDATWKHWQKVLFRYSFISLALLSLIAYNPIIQILNITWEKQTAFFARLKNCATWLDNHLYHLGYLPAIHSPEFSDTHFGVIITFTILIFSIFVTLLWTAFDKATNYNRLYFWFSDYLAYYIFLAMARYAIYKIIPIQATYPNALQLISHVGSFRKWELLFLFMGTSPAYCMFCGWVEFIASGLLLFNRTRILGGLIMTVALIQIVCFNICYNNSIILLSSILLLSTFFLMARALPKLYKILVKLQPVSLAEYKYGFTTSWKKYMVILFCLLPLWKTYAVSSQAWKFYCLKEDDRKRQQLYTVSKFEVKNDTMQSLTLDTLRWRYVVFLQKSSHSQTMVYYNVQEKAKYYSYRWDTVKRTLLIFSKKDVMHGDTFEYSRAVNGDIQLKGVWNGKSVSIELKNTPVDSMTLVKDRFSFIQED